MHKRHEVMLVKLHRLLICRHVSSTFLQCYCPHTQMTANQDPPMDGQPTTAVFVAKGIDVTPSKDRGVVKVLILFIKAFDLFRHFNEFTKMLG